MRIRFFNTYEPVTTFYRDLVPFLTASGNEVEIVMSKAEYREGRDLAKALAHLDSVSIFKTANLGIQPHHSIAKVLVTVAYIIHAAIHSLFGPSVDCNVFLTQPPLFALWGYVLSKLRRQPYYCMVMDVYPQLMVEYGMMRRDAILTHWLSWLSRWALRNAEGVIVIGRCMAQHLQAMGIQPEYIHLIPNWIDEDLVHPVEHRHNPLRKAWRLEDKFVVLYSGNLGLSHYFDDILTVAGQMKEREDIAFVFIGGGARHKEVASYVERHNLTNVKLLPFQDIEVLAQSLSAGDLHLVVLRDNCTGLVVPSKAYGILAVGRPILYQGSQEGEIAQMILEEDIGTVVSCGDVEGLKHAILKYVNQPEFCEVQGHKARKLVEGPYSHTRALEKYIEVLMGSMNEREF